MHNHFLVNYIVYRLELLLDLKEGAVSNANSKAFEAALFLCLEAKIHKIKKKASKRGINKYDKKMIAK